MKLYKRILSLILLAVFIIGGSFTAVNVFGTAAENKISEYKSVINVQVDGTMLVTDTITVDLNTPQDQIYKMISIKGPWYQTINGKDTVINGTAKVDQVKANVEFFTTKTSNFFVIDFNTTGKTGKQTIEYSYRCRISAEPVDGKNILYYEPLSFDNDRPIQKADITINMPKPVSADQTTVLASDLNSSNDQTKNINYKVNGKQIHIITTKELPTESGITVTHDLPDGYFGKQIPQDTAETSPADSEKENNAAAYDIKPNENYAKNYDVVMNVNEDKTIDITETITMDFKEAKHGIYRYIPLNGTGFYHHNGKRVESDRSIKVDNVEVDGGYYELENDIDDASNDIEVIRIGDPDKLVTGLHTYKISYRVRMYDDGMDDHDLFYYNVLPGNFLRPIENATVKINMPKPIDKNKLDIYAGPNGSNDLEDHVDVMIDNKQIFLDTKNPFPKEAGVTVLAKLPEGYFQGAMQTDWALVAIICTALLSIILILILWLLFGRDRKMVMPIEFHPPENLTPAEIDYIRMKQVGTRAVIGMIFIFAHKGYLKIEELSYKEILLQRLDKSPENLTELLYLDGMFGGENVIMLPSKTFVQRMKETNKKLADLIDRDNRFNGIKEINEKSSAIARKVSMIFMALPMLAGWFFGLVHSRAPDLFISGGVGLICSAVMLLILIFAASSDSIYFEGIWGGVIVIFILLIINGAIMWWADHDFIVVIITIVSTTITFSLTMSMGRLTEQGNKLVGRIMGFINFIEVAELDRLNMLIEENPYYYYNILPYAYLFDLTNKWAEKFENMVLEPATWFIGNSENSLYKTSNFHVLFNRMEEFTSPDLDYSASGSSSSSGGFGGGGGFSGGGSGGGGGGDW